MCAERGTDWNVLSVRSEEEHVFLSGILEADTWLGASDATTANRWLWLDDDTAFWQGAAGGMVLNGLFAAWDDREPSAAIDEQCARYHLSDSEDEWTWSDCPCGAVGGGLWGGGNFGGPGDDDDVNLPACKGPEPVPAL